MDLTPLQLYIQRVSSLLHQLYALKVVLPGLCRCTTCGRDRPIVNAVAVVAPQDRYLLLAVCDECDRTNKVDTVLVSQYHPHGVTPIEEGLEKLLEQIRQETGLRYFNHPDEWGALHNGGPAYQSPTARAYLNNRSTFKES
jgi:phosphoketolase